MVELRKRNLEQCVTMNGDVRVKVLTYLIRFRKPSRNRETPVIFLNNKLEAIRSLSLVLKLYIRLRFGATAQKRLVLNLTFRIDQPN